MDVNKISLRFAIVGAIAVALLLPLAMIQELVDERAFYFQTATQSVTDGWGNAQKIVGPVLIVKQRRADGWAVQGETPPRLVIPAQDVTAQIEVRHEIRQRGIFEAPVYVANVSLSGHFAPHALEDDLDWASARLVFGISDSHGIRDVTLVVANEPQQPQPLAATAWFGGGLQADVDLSGTTADVPFNLTVSLRGSTSLSTILPAARSQLTMTSSWPHPSFRGRFLPDTLRTSTDGFSASWASHELAHGFPKRWADETTADVLHGKGVIVDLYEPVSTYRSVERAVKYGPLFLAITFLTLLCFELASGMRFHFVQYGATGLAMLLFYLALLSLAEHVSFAGSYATATLLLISLTGWYVSRITRTRRLAAIFVGVLICVYGVLFMLLRMEAYALMAGTAVLLAGVAALMWTTQGLTERQAHDDDST